MRSAYKFFLRIIRLIWSEISNTMPSNLYNDDNLINEMSRI